MQNYFVIFDRFLSYSYTHKFKSKNLKQNTISKSTLYSSVHLAQITFYEN